jgi:hypothetical protein
MHTIIKYFKKHNGPLPSYNALHPFHTPRLEVHVINKTINHSEKS